MYGLLDNDLDKRDYDYRVQRAERAYRKHDHHPSPVARGLQVVGKALTAVGQKVKPQQPPKVASQA